MSGTSYQATVTMSLWILEYISALPIETLGEKKIDGVVDAQMHVSGPPARDVWLIMCGSW